MAGAVRPTQPLASQGARSQLPVAVREPATVAVCSRNRPAMLERAVDSILRARPPGTLVMVVDQSDEPSSVLQARAADGEIEYIVDQGRGLSRAQNMVLRQARTEVVIFIDDDCEIEADTLAALERALDGRPDVAVVFGTVYAPASVSDRGFIPTYEPPRAQVLRGRLGKLRDGGISACMAVRRTQALSVGGLDERLGPGAPVAACEDGEFAYRMLKHGYGLAHAPDARVLHHGLREWSEGRRYAFDTYRGIGAAFALHLRGGDPVAALLILQQAGFICRELLNGVRHGRRPRGFIKMLGLMAGVPVGLRLGMRRAQAALIAAVPAALGAVASSGVSTELL